MTRLATVVVKPEEGFVADYMRLETDVRIRDPFYQEFLRPHDCLHQAAAFLDTSNDGELKFQLFRDRRQGPFEASELEGFNRDPPLSALGRDGVARRFAEEIRQYYQIMASVIGHSYLVMPAQGRMADQRVVDPTRLSLAISA